MFEEDLKINPIPECVYLDNVQVWVTYRTQVNLCHNCGKGGHFFNTCPDRVAFPVLGSTEGTSNSSVFMDGIRPTRSTKEKDGRKKDLGSKNSNIGQNGLVGGNTEGGKEGNGTNEGGTTVNQSGENNSNSDKLAKKNFDNGAKAAQSSQLVDKAAEVPNSNATTNSSLKRKNMDDDDHEPSNAKIHVVEENEHSEGEVSEGKSEYMEEEEENDQNSGFWDVSDELRTDMVIGNTEVVISPKEDKPG